MSYQTDTPVRSSRFATTRWTVVLSARDRADSAGREAMEHLARAYWYPVYVYVRRNGASAEDAKDLTQGFFERLLEKRFLRLVAPEKGRFRTFLIVALKRYLVGEWRRKRAIKRGGGRSLLSIERDMAEERYAAEPLDTESPEVLYDRRWALTLLERALDRLRESYESTGRREVYREFKDFLTAGSGDVSIAERAAAAGMSETAARVAVHRMRRRFRDLFRKELAETVSPENADEELRDLLVILSEGQ